MAKPKTLAVVHKNFQRRRRSVAEHEDLTAERIVLEHLFADLGQAIDSFAKIGRFDGYQNLHLRRDLDHDSAFQKLRPKATRSGIAPVIVATTGSPWANASATAIPYVSCQVASTKTSALS